MSSKSQYKKRITVTLSPSLYHIIVDMNEPVSRIVENALRAYVERNRMEAIRNDLEKKKYDSLYLAHQLDVSHDFFDAEV